MFYLVKCQLCFGCRDTEDTGDCQTSDISDMYNLNYIYKTEYTQDDNGTNNFLKANPRNPLIQDCRPYGYKYCCIEELERLGTIQSYIRGCCDGKNFSVTISDVPKLKFAVPNNQSLCGYFENKGLVVCVTVCNGTFCNGPSFADSVHIFPVGFLFVCHLIWWLLKT